MMGRVDEALRRAADEHAASERTPPGNRRHRRAAPKAFPRRCSEPVYAAVSPTRTRARRKPTPSRRHSPLASRAARLEVPSSLMRADDGPRSRRRSSSTSTRRRSRASSIGSWQRRCISAGAAGLKVVMIASAVPAKARR